MKEGKKGKKKKCQEQCRDNCANLLYVNSTTSIISVYVNGPNAAFKIQRLSEYLKADFS